MEDLLSLADAADELHVAPVTLRAAVARRALAAKKFGKTWVTTRSEVERYRRDSLGQVGRPIEQVLEIATPDGFSGTVTYKVNRSDLPAATNWMGAVQARASHWYELIGASQDGFVADLETDPDLEGREVHLTIRRRAVIGEYPPTAVLADDERTTVKQTIVPPTREPGH